MSDDTASAESDGADPDITEKVISGDAWAEYCDMLKAAGQVVLDLAHVVGDTPQARDARADALAREREELGVALAAVEHGLHKLGGRLVASGTAGDAQYLHRGLLVA